MQKPNLDNIRFKSAMLRGDIKTISEDIDAFVNSDAGVRTFDITLVAAQGTGEKAELAKVTLQRILANPTWNPNYKGPDMWHPEERAMINHCEDIAIAVIKHKNFDRTQLPRVITSAEQFGAKKVLAYLKRQKQRVRG